MNNPTRVVSLRLPSAAYGALQRAAAHAGLSVSGGLDVLLCNSFDNGQLLFALPDCPEALDIKLDVRVPPATYERLKTVTGRSFMPVSVYIRKLLYHVYVTKAVRYVEAVGHYTLAGRHD
jgi:hypothetical protein